MILQVVSVFDTAAGAFGRPAFVQSVGAAIRSFSDEVNREAVDNTMFAHPADFQLYHLGSWDDAMGHISMLNQPNRLASGSEVKL